MVEILISTIAFLASCGTVLISVKIISRLEKECDEWRARYEKERAEWNTERSKLLDRIQSSGLAEFKAQERADTPIKRIVKDPLIAKLESEPWL